VPISDCREIAFDAAATVAAVACSRRMMRAIGLPAAAPEDVRFDPAEAKVTLLYGINPEAFPDYAIPFQAVIIQAGPLSALLISYCMRTGIRIPRHLGRSLRVDRDAVVLVFSQSHPVPPVSITPERTGEEDVGRSKSWLNMPLEPRRRGR
jgi:hypothetical protein